MLSIEPLRFLSHKEMEKIHEGALEILEHIGMRIDHDEALEYLEEIGCRVDYDKKEVKFPASLTDRYINKMREDYKNPARVPEKMAVRYSQVKFKTEPFKIHQDFSVNSGGFCCFIYDFEEKKRNATLEDVRDAITLADKLENITATGLPCVAQEIPAALRPIKMAAELVKYTNKLGGIEAFTAFDVEYITRIAEIVAGSKENLRKNPILVGYGEIRSPLCFDRNMVEVFLAYIKRGIPQTVDTMPCGGTTAPVTSAGCLALGIAESIAGLILGYAVNEDAVIGIDVTPSVADMQSGLFRYAAPERWPLLGARVQMISEYYGCPSGIHGGKTDSCFPGIRVGIEKAFSMLMPVLCGSIGIGTIGHLENAVTFSPLQLVIDNEIAGYLRHSLKGIEVNEETLAIDEIKKVGIGGNFLTSEHTCKHFRKELYLNNFFAAKPWTIAREKEGEDFKRLAIEKAKKIISSERTNYLTKAQEKEINKIVEEAKRKLGGGEK